MNTQTLNDTSILYNQATETINKLISKSKHHKSTSLRSSVAAMFTADDKSDLHFSGKIGMLQLDMDRQVKCHFLRFYDLDSLGLLLELELYYGFGQNLRQIKPSIYIFEYFKSGLFGFAFKSKEQAEMMVSKIRSVSPKISELNELKKQRSKIEQQQKKQSSFFGKIKKKLGTIKNDIEQKIESKVLHVVKDQSCIEFDPKTGQFDCKNLSPAMEQILLKAGVKKKDLKNKEILNIIFEETLIFQARNTALKQPQLVDQLHLKLILQNLKDQQSTIQPDSQDETFNKSQPTLPPPPTLLLVPQNLANNPVNNRASISRADLMNEIRNNKLKLKPINTKVSGGIEFNPSIMNKEQRDDLASHIRSKLIRRKQALNRRNSSDEDESD